MLLVFILDAFCFLCFATKCGESWDDEETATSIRFITFTCEADDEDLLVFCSKFKFKSCCFDVFFMLCKDDVVKVKDSGESDDLTLATGADLSDPDSCSCCLMFLCYKCKEWEDEDDETETCEKVGKASKIKC